MSASPSSEPEATREGDERRAEKPKPVREAAKQGATRTRTVERSAGGVVVRVLEGGPHFLLIRDPYRRWGLPKGHLEEGEANEAAALREVREEAEKQGTTSPEHAPFSIGIPGNTEHAVC